MKNSWVRRLLALIMVMMLAVPAVALADIDPAALTAIEITNDATGTTAFHSGDTLQKNVGDSGVFSVDGAVKSFKSSKSRVVSIDASGRYTCLTEGKAKITITLQNRSKLRFTINVADPYKPSSVSFAQGASVSLYAGTTLKLTPRLYPSTARTTYTWKSNKKKVATVDANGTITAGKPGRARITVTTANKKKATIEVNVLQNKLDNITAVPTTYDIQHLSNKWSLRPKSIEISGNDVILEFYLLNNIGRASKLDIDNYTIYFPDGRYFYCTASRVKASCKKGKYKVVKVTCKGAASSTRGWILPTYNVRSISASFRGRIYYR